MGWNPLSFCRLGVVCVLLIAAASASVTAQETPLLVVNGVSAPTPQTAAPGSTLAVTVSGAPGSTTDWVGLYRAGSTNHQYLDWRYLNGSTTPPVAPLTSGSLLFLFAR